MKRIARIVLIGMAATAMATTATAQTAAANQTGQTTERPKPVATSQATADDAARKAAAQGDTGQATLVRTGPSAADRAKEAATSTKSKVKSAKNTVGNKTGDTATPNDMNSK